MRIYADKESLLEVGQSVLRVLSARATLPVLAGVRITASEDGVEFAATDLEMFLRVTGDFNVEEPGTVVVPGRLMGEILRSLPSGKVTITGKQGEVRIEAAMSEFSMAGYSAADFPQAPEVGAEGASTVVASDLAASLRQVVRAASVDEARPVLTGVLWALEGEGLNLAATDSFRLAVKGLPVKEAQAEGKAIIPARALSEFARHLQGDQVAQVALGESQAELTVGSVRIVTRLIEGEYPNYRQLIPESFASRLEVEREHFSQVVERVALVAQSNTPVKIHLGEEVQVTASEAGVAEASETVEGASYNGQPMVIAFNPRFLTDGLDGISAEKAVIEVNDSAKPAVIRPAEEDGYLYLLMPVRLPS